MIVYTCERREPSRSPLVPVSSETVWVSAKSSPPKEKVLLATVPEPVTSTEGWLPLPPMSPTYPSAYFRCPMITMYSRGIATPSSVGYFSWRAMKSRFKASRRSGSRLPARVLVGP